MVSDTSSISPRRRRGSLPLAFALVAAGGPGWHAQPATHGRWPGLTGKTGQPAARIPMFVQVNEQDAAVRIRFGGGAVLAGGPASRK